MATAKLTAKGVEALTTERVQEDVWDELTPGLCLRVSRAGSKTWYVRYRVNGKRRRHKIGSFPRLSLAKARKRARDALTAADAGEDPAQERAERKAGATTFQALAQEVLKARAARTREATQRERARLLEKELLPAWGDRDATSITRRDVVTLVEGIVERGAPVVANRTLSLIHLVFNDGIRRGWPGLEANPAHLVEPPGQEKGRDRYLDPDELRAVWKATEDETPGTRGSFRLAFLTGQRIGSILAMRWEDVVGDLWTIPEEVFKGKRPHLVPLSREALVVLEALRELRVDGERYVFPSRAGAKLPHLGNLTSKALPRVRKAAGIPHWTLHDARRTFRTWATRSPDADPPGLGIPPAVADSVLGHVEASLGFQRYTGDRDRYLLAEKRKGLEKWGRFVREAVEGEGRS